jgi:hypothetical protein
MKFINQKFIFFVTVFFGFLLSESNHTSCILDKNIRDITRNDFIEPEIIQSENFVIHFTTSETDCQLINEECISLQSNYGYAQSIIDHAEAALIQYLQDGWENIPPDCDELITDIESPDHCINFGGNSLYDIYISNEGPGMVVPDNPYPVFPYLGGYTSYMKISTLSNNYQSLPSWNYHVVAHELHHAIQLRYGYSVSGTSGNYMHNGWFFEQTASYMENVIYPNSFHVQTMLGNCDVVTPLTYPEYGIDYPTEIYPYRSALWQKFLVESLGDSSIVRYFWEDYGAEYASGDPVSLFPIYNNAIEYVTNENESLFNTYVDYAIWRYFTGERSIPDNYFNESLNYCTASTLSDFENSFTLSTNKGAGLFIELPSESINLIIYTDYINDIQLSHIKINQNNLIEIVPLFTTNNFYDLDLDSEYSNVLIATSNYNDIQSSNIDFSISINDLNILGDVNQDSILNVQDIVLMINIVLMNDYDIIADVNEDGFVNILDVVVMINILVGGLP